MMSVEIGEIHSTVNTLDDQALLSPRVLRLIVDTVLESVNEQQAHRQRVNSEQQISSGVAAEQRGGV